MDARTRRSLNSLIKHLRSAKNNHRLEDIGAILDELAGLPDVRLFAMMFPEKKQQDFKD